MDQSPAACEMELGPPGDAVACGVLAVGRCARCGIAFCASHRANYQNVYCARCGPVAATESLNEFMASLRDPEAVYPMHVRIVRHLIRHPLDPLPITRGQRALQQAGYGGLDR